MHRDWADLHLVVCDDDPAVRLAVRTFLRRELHCRVTECRNGFELLEVVASTPTDGLILDLHMPELGGLQTLAALGEMGTSLPVLILTADQYEPTVRQAAQLGAKEFVLKPPQPTVLVNRVRRMLARYLWTPSPSS